jgi:hypothetical protein
MKTSFSWPYRRTRAISCNSLLSFRARWRAGDICAVARRSSMLCVCRDVCGARARGRSVRRVCRCRVRARPHAFLAVSRCLASVCPCCSWCVCVWKLLTRSVSPVVPHATRALAPPCPNMEHGPPLYTRRARFRELRQELSQAPWSEAEFRRLGRTKYVRENSSISLHIVRMPAGEFIGSCRHATRIPQVN